MNPAVIIADEPTGNLDSKNGKQFMKLIRQTQEALNQTILLVTHDLNLAEQADRILYIEDGKIMSDRSAYAKN
jgi:putative ABC transport system ATP-binding protein